MLEPVERRRVFRHRKPVQSRYSMGDGVEGAALVRAEDIGLSGIQFPSKTPLPEGAQITVELEVDGDWIPLRLAEVVWSQPSTVSDGYLNGVRFETLEASVYRRLILEDDTHAAT